MDAAMAPLASRGASRIRMYSGFPRSSSGLYSRQAMPCVEIQVHPSASNPCAGSARRGAGTTPRLFRNASLHFAERRFSSARSTVPLSPRL